LAVEDKKRKLEALRRQQEELQRQMAELEGSDTAAPPTKPPTEEEEKKKRVKKAEKEEIKIEKKEDAESDSSSEDDNSSSDTDDSSSEESNDDAVSSDSDSEDEAEGGDLVKQRIREAKTGTLVRPADTAPAEEKRAFAIAYAKTAKTVETAREALDMLKAYADESLLKYVEKKQQNVVKKYGKTIVTSDSDLLEKAKSQYSSLTTAQRTAVLYFKFKNFVDSKQDIRTEEVRQAQDRLMQLSYQDEEMLRRDSLALYGFNVDANAFAPLNVLTGKPNVEALLIQFERDLFSKERILADLQRYKEWYKTKNAAKTPEARTKDAETRKAGKKVPVPNPPAEMDILYYSSFDDAENPDRYTRLHINESFFYQRVMPWLSQVPMKSVPDRFWIYRVALDGREASLAEVYTDPFRSTFLAAIEKLPQELKDLSTSLWKRFPSKNAHTSMFKLNAVQTEFWSTQVKFIEAMIDWQNKYADKASSRSAKFVPWTNDDLVTAKKKEIRYEFDTFFAHLYGYNFIRYGKRDGTDQIFHTDPYSQYKILQYKLFSKLLLSARSGAHLSLRTNPTAKPLNDTVVEYVAANVEADGIGARGKLYLPLELHAYPKSASAYPGYKPPTNALVIAGVKRMCVNYSEIITPFLTKHAAAVAAKKTVSDSDTSRFAAIKRLFGDQKTYPGKDKTAIPYNGILVYTSVTVRDSKTFHRPSLNPEDSKRHKEESAKAQMVGFVQWYTLEFDKWDEPQLVTVTAIPAEKHPDSSIPAGDVLGISVTQSDTKLSEDYFTNKLQSARTTLFVGTGKDYITSKDARKMSAFENGDEAMDWLTDRVDKERILTVEAVLQHAIGAYIHKTAGAQMRENFEAVSVARLKAITAQLYGDEISDEQKEQLKAAFKSTAKEIIKNYGSEIKKAFDGLIAEWARVRAMIKKEKATELGAIGDRSTFEVTVTRGDSILASNVFHGVKMYIVTSPSFVVDASKLPDPSGRFSVSPDIEALSSPSGSKREKEGSQSSTSSDKKTKKKKKDEETSESDDNSDDILVLGGSDDESDEEREDTKSSIDTWREAIQILGERTVERVVLEPQGASSVLQNSERSRINNKFYGVEPSSVVQLLLYVKKQVGSRKSQLAASEFKVLDPNDSSVAYKTYSRMRTFPSKNKSVPSVDDLRGVNRGTDFVVYVKFAESAALQLLVSGRNDIINNRRQNTTDIKERTEREEKRKLDSIQEELFSKQTADVALKKLDPDITSYAAAKKKKAALMAIKTRSLKENELLDAVNVWLERTKDLAKLQHERNNEKEVSDLVETELDNLANRKKRDDTGSFLHLKIAELDLDLVGGEVWKQFTGRTRSDSDRVNRGSNAGYFDKYIVPEDRGVLVSTVAGKEPEQRSFFKHYGLEYINLKVFEIAEARTASEDFLAEAAKQGLNSFGGLDENVEPITKKKGGKGVQNATDEDAVFVSRETFDASFVSREAFDIWYSLEQLNPPVPGRSPTVAIMLPEPLPSKATEYPMLSISDASTTTGIISPMIQAQIAGKP
jgi:hypothetical protein